MSEFGQVPPTSPVIPVATPVEPVGPWGFWATFGLSLGILFGFVVAQGIVGGVYGFSASTSDPNLDFDALVKELESDGFFLMIATLASVPVVVGLTVLFAALRRGMRWTDYLGLRLPPWREWFRWTAYLFAFLFVSDLIVVFLEFPPEPFMLETYETSRIPALFVLAIVVGAPVWEETFYRGFMLTGFRHSAVGAVGASMLTAMAWASFHLQYEGHVVVIIMLLGCLLAAARIRTGSLLLCIYLHCVNNFLSVLIAIFKPEWFEVPGGM